MDQPRINHGSTWINVDQRGSVAFSLPPSRLMAHVSCVRLMAHVSCVRLMAHASGVRRPMRQASGVRRQTHGSCVRRPASHVSRPMRPASHVSRPMRQTPRAPIQPIQPPPLSVMTTTKRRHFPMLLLLGLRPLRCTAWGNRVVLPPPYSAMGTNKNSGRHSNERRPLLLLNEKGPALRRPCF